MCRYREAYSTDSERANRSSRARIPILLHCRPRALAAPVECIVRESELERGPLTHRRMKQETREEGGGGGGGKGWCSRPLVVIGATVVRGHGGQFEIKAMPTVHD